MLSARKMGQASCNYAPVISIHSELQTLRNTIDKINKMLFKIIISVKKVIYVLVFSIEQYELRVLKLLISHNEEHLLYLLLKKVRVRNWTGIIT